MTDLNPAAELTRLRLRLDEAEETIRAIRAGAVDAFLVEAASGPQVYTLESADRPYRLLVEEMHQGALTLGRDGTIAYCNRRFASLVGKPLERLVGLAFGDFIPPDERADYESLLEQGRIGNSQGECHLQEADGALVPVLLTLNALPPDSGVAVGLLVTDLTRQRHQEKLNALLERLEEADHRKNEFLAMLGHELRGPLAPIVSALQLLDSEDARESPGRKQARGIIERQTGRLRQLVDELLEVSRITTGKLEISPKRVALSEIVDGATEAVRPLIAQRRHELTVSLPKEPIWLHGDAARLEQVLVNLLDNAATYTEERGRIWLTVELASAQGAGLQDAADGTDEAALVPPQVVIRVRDTGVGIDPSLLPRIFDLFSQATRSLDRSQGGLGIGLALVHRLTALHGGTVEARSELGHGSELVVRLPMLPNEARPSAPPVVAIDQPTTRPLRILVVDDHEDTLLTYALMLRSWGHEVRTATDGPTAVQAAIDYQPDVAMLDIGLPGLDGYQVARRIRQEPALGNVVLVAVTGYGQDSDQKASQQAGFDHHMAKPARLELLREILASVPLAQPWASRGPSAT